METSTSYDINAFLALLKKRGIRDEAVLKAMASVPRERFVGIDLAAFAYDDAPLPIGEGQTISQPSLVALMIQALNLHHDDTVLEIGTGSGYAAAILSRMVRQVYSIERHQGLADTARQRLQELGYGNVDVRCSDGTLGWPEHAPFDAILVTAGGPETPRSLMNQLATGGCLVIPAGPTPHQQQLLRLTRLVDDTMEVEELGGVRFVPLIGEEGWQDVAQELAPGLLCKTTEPEPLSRQIEQAAIVIPSIDSVDLNSLLDRIGDARLVLLGEATHGSAEFYEMRARISRELIIHKGFNLVAVEADWPDAAQINHFVLDTRGEPTQESTFSRFPTWMWANRQVLEFVQWLRNHNRKMQKEADQTGFYGLDLYSMYASINAVIDYLDTVDAMAAQEARHRYGCLMAWADDPASYGRITSSERHENCEPGVVSMLSELLQKRLQYSIHDGRKFLDAVANARLVRDAEKYYRVMYRGSASAWNLRDTHMFETLEYLLDFHGPESRAIVWAHNSHTGNAQATEMSSRGEFNVGSLCREKFGDSAYLIGFGTNHGTVAAASDWGAPMEVKAVLPARPGSYERLCHDSGMSAFMLPLRHAGSSLKKALTPGRLERAIGVIYRPETELQSHYLTASLPQQFDEYIWFDETRAVEALGLEAGPGMPETFPFGL